MWNRILLVCVRTVCKALLITEALAFAPQLLPERALGETISKDFSQYLFHRQQLPLHIKYKVGRDPNLPKEIMKSQKKCSWQESDLRTNPSVRQ